MLLKNIFYTFIVVLIIWISFTFVHSKEMSTNEATRNMSQSVFDSCIKFSSSFYKVLASNTSGNIISSPLSVHVILSLLSRGANGPTAKELTAGLYLSNVDSLVHDGFKFLLSMLNDIKQVGFTLANTICVQEDISLVPDFVSISSESFHSNIQKVNFKDAAGAIKQINAWVEEKTKHKITDIVSADNINEETIVLLMNAIYFKGDWLCKFEPKFTGKRLFHVNKYKTKLVPTMFKKFNFCHTQVPSLDARILKIPYLNDDLDMIIILPNELEGLRFMEENFDWDTIVKTSCTESEVVLYMPKFKLESTMNLEETLNKINLGRIFTNNADFNGVSADIPLKVSEIIQKAFIEVNEEGSEAAATTSVRIMKRSITLSPEEFDVNRPFMFAIRHKPSNIPLFIGSVKDLNIHPEKDEL